MGLSSALQVGRSGLLTAQTAIEVAGNNLTNVASRGYHRQVLSVAPAGTTEIGNGVFIGRGAQIQQITRSVDEALEGRIRGSIADQSRSVVKQEFLQQVEALQNELTGIDLSTHLNDFFNAFGELSNQPLDTALRSLAIQQGDVLGNFIRTLREGFTDLRGQLDERIANTVKAADDVLTQVESINRQISNAESGGGGAHDLRDQRDTLLAELSEFVDVSVIEQASGVVDVFVGSLPIVLNGQSRGLDLRSSTDANGNLLQTVVIGADQSPIDVSAGELGALIELREQDIVGAISTLDQFTEQLIFQFNRVHSTGQGTRGFASVTSASPVLDPTVALNDPAAGLDFTPQHGSFQLHVTQKSTGQRGTTTIDIDLDGINPAGDTTLNSLAADINAIANVTASVTPSGRLQIDVNSSDFEISFSDDTADVLATLGVNTFFTGNNSFDIGINDTVKSNVGFIAAGRNHVPGDNSNALQLEGLRTKRFNQLGGLSLTDMWARHIEGVAIGLDQANRQVEADSVVLESLRSQQQTVSGVNADEEAINLLAFQRMFQASARFLNVVDEMIETVLGLA